MAVAKGSCYGIKKRKLEAVKKIAGGPDMKRGEKRGAKEKVGPWLVGPLHGGDRMRGSHEVYLASFGHRGEAEGMI